MFRNHGLGLFADALFDWSPPRFQPELLRQGTWTVTASNGALEIVNNDPRLLCGRPAAAWMHRLFLPVLLALLAALPLGIGGGLVAVAVMRPAWWVAIFGGPIAMFGVFVLISAAVKGRVPPRPRLRVDADGTITGLCHDQRVPRVFWSVRRLRTFPVSDVQKIELRVAFWRGTPDADPGGIIQPQHTTVSLHLVVGRAGFVLAAPWTDRLEPEEWIEARAPLGALAVELGRRCGAKVTATYFQAETRVLFDPAGPSAVDCAPTG